MTELLGDRYRLLRRLSDGKGERLELEDTWLRQRRSGRILATDKAPVENLDVDLILRWEVLRSGSVSGTARLNAQEALGNGELLLVSDDLPEMTLEEYLVGQPQDSPIRLRLVSDLFRTVDQLHSHGLSLGGIGMRDVLVRGSGEPVLAGPELPVERATDREQDLKDLMKIASRLLGTEGSLETERAAEPTEKRSHPESEPVIEMRQEESALHRSDRLIRVTPLEFYMGSLPEEAGHLPHEGPRYRVRIDRPYRVAVHPVTRAGFRRFIEETGHLTLPEREGEGSPPAGWGLGRLRQGQAWQDPGIAQDDDHPVVGVSWLDAVAYCNWISLQRGTATCYTVTEGKIVWDRGSDGYRLPTEAEWECACRAGTTSRFGRGDDPADLERVGWYRENSGGTTQPVGGLEPNPLGVHDLLGNVWEWCWDLYGAYNRRNDLNPSGPSKGSHERVVRGGCFLSVANECRAASRGRAPQRGAFRGIGFRLFRSMP